jgi:deoxyribodipyrimidine photo-lyase
MALETTKSLQIIIYLLRNDLRLHDNECIHFINSIAESSIKNQRASKDTLLQLVPLYCFQSNHYLKGTRHFGFSRVGEPRARFIFEALSNLKTELQSRGSGLIIRSCFADPGNGNPILAIKSVIEQLNIVRNDDTSSNCTLVFHEEVTKEEVDMEASLVELCKEYGVCVKTFWGSTLYHRDDLFMFGKTVNNNPNIPDVYTQFRKAVESEGKIRSPFKTPVKLPPLPNGITSDKLPDINQIFNSSKSAENAERVPAKRSAFPFKGGEVCALKRLHHYLWETNAISSYKETRNGLVGTQYSTKFSPWLAIGNLSPRMIYAEVKKFEASRVKNQSTYWVIFELIWRDYFRYVCLKYGNAVFQAGGIRGLQVKWKQDFGRFDRWKSGSTGVPFVDANMRELLNTGWMSNRGRQNVASFLVKDLKLDWRLGAEWFESMLIDHDVCSNYGNWNYAAGIGNDPRENRKFNVVKQGFDYDPNGRFVKLWIPELAPLAKQPCPGKIHVPWKVLWTDLETAGIKMGVTYPKPMVEAGEWKKHYSKVFDKQGRALKAHGRAKQGKAFKSRSRAKKGRSLKSRGRPK